MRGELQVRWGHLNYATATLAAMEIHNREYAWRHGRMHDFTPISEVHRITVNQLRHRYTNYDWLVNGLFCEGDEWRLG